jgi:tetratricopeptide (TPR) repeat protein
MFLKQGILAKYNIQQFSILIILLIHLGNVGFVISQGVKPNKEEARLLKDGQKYEEAHLAYSKLIETDPTDYESYIERAFCNEKMNRYEEAINDYRTALNLKPGEIDLYRKALIDYLQIENYNQATEMFSTLVQIKNKTVAAYQKMALDKIKLKDYEGAVKEINTTSSLAFTGTSKIQIPLRTNLDLTKYSLILNSTDAAIDNEDFLQFNYTSQNLFVSRACGFKTNFTLDPTLPFIKTETSITDGYWIQNVVINTSNVTTENETHVKIYF